MIVQGGLIEKLGKHEHTLPPRRRLYQSAIVCSCSYGQQRAYLRGKLLLAFVSISYHPLMVPDFPIA